ncbi:pyridoxamine 5'-phosphate oxidase [Croceicoccus sp. YJ47]|uniref:pyridoxamine 5'-phosphate oxidase n=1 Tax=Croceicoccus sp. YJ47 TaxID=2798724 RepID=UPI001925036C|nr:pyridoxamine 5'-phosphate oxidase [Croceicoccus sp. YJ47]QQN75462.1 pyridoxamine 5'-phosphate oxidase [Croceicoccus sp. YJ47]
MTEISNETTIPAHDPHGLFTQWMAEARASEPNDGNAVALATATPDGAPSVRMVLLKGHEDGTADRGPGGFVFYTNLTSRKAGELLANPQAAMLFHWKSLRRQIRITGRVAQVSDDEADAYFATRSRDSQLGAHASDQSSPLPDRQDFVDRFEQARDRYEGQDVPRPEFWSGFRLTPDAIEFWSDRPHRLHERRVFRAADGGWTSAMLYP